MSGTKQSKPDKPAKKSPFVVGSTSFKENMPRPQRRKLAWLAAILLVIVLLGTLYQLVFNKPVPQSTKQAISTAQAEAKGFDTKDQGYIYSQLNSAVALAQAKKCSEARGLFDSLKDNPNGVTELAFSSYKVRIDKACAAK